VFHVDLAGIGAGPSNLSLAALAEPVRTLRCRFLERQADPRWHPGLMLPDSALQVSYLKDLVTLVDPTNPYTFLNFLACTGRLHRFASVPTQVVSRREFEAYYRWSARQLESVQTGCEVREVTYRDGAFRLGTSDAEYTSQHLSVGTGPSPVIPDAALPHLGSTVFHASHFKDHLGSLAGKRVAVVGGGQSGAEVVAHLLDLQEHQAVTSLVWASRRPGFPQLDDSAFANEWFQPDYVRHFHGLAEQRRRHLLAIQQLASDGISADLLERIYRRLYVNDFVDDAPLSYTLLPGRELAGIVPLVHDHGWRVELTHTDTGIPEMVSADVVILATGFRFRIPDALLPMADRIALGADGELALQADYSALWDGPAGNKLFFLNAGRLSHGIADPNLSLSSWRAAVVLNSLTAGTAYATVHGRSSASTWGPDTKRRRGALSATRTRELTRSLPVTVHHLIIPSNPTPNGDVHLGHIAGPFIGADALRRGALQRAEPAGVMLGTAWQNTHVMLAARRQGRPYLEVAASFAGEIESSFESVGIGYDIMLRHGDTSAIEDRTRLAYRRLREEGSLIIRDTIAQFCQSPGCEDWRFQGFVSGRCPHCGSLDAAGIDCEGCGLYHDDGELLDPHCSICGDRTVRRSLRRGFLELEPLRGWFENYFGKTAMGPVVRSFAQDVLSRPLPSVAVTFQAPLGIAAQDPELPGQMIYPAFELAPRYTVMVDRYRETEAVADLLDSSTLRTTMLFGFDNAFERIFLFPAILRVLESEHAPLPDVMQMSYFYLLEGSKFSTSRGHLINVRELVGEAGADAVRLYLAATRPETGPSDFTLSAFRSSPEAAAVRSLVQWARTGRSPAAPEGLRAGESRQELAKASRMLHQALLPETLSCSQAAQAVLHLTRLAGVAADAVAADTADTDKVADASMLQEAVLHSLVNGAGALIPDTAKELRKAFSVPRIPFQGRIPAFPLLQDSDVEA
jgi:methionyl-tRNA synthetase